MEITDAFARLSALAETLRVTIVPSIRIYDPKQVTDLFTRYARIREALRTAVPRLFDDLPVRQLTPVRSSAQYQGNGIGSDDVLALLLDVRYCLTALSSVPDTGTVAMSVTREGVFLAGQYFDALQRVREIFDTARVSIVVIDGYVDAKVLDLLTVKSAAVVVSILTKTVSPALNTAASAFNKQYGGLSVRTSNTFHDRFVIVDDQDFYHFGASLKDAGNRGFMFSRIEEPAVIRTMRDAFTSEWKAARVVI